jgi:hypothetical protein
MSAGQPAPQFTPQDAQALVNLVESAPLRNMQHAEAVVQLLRKFKAFYDYVQPLGAGDAATGA